MRSLIFLLGFLALSTGLSAAQLTVTATPYSLAGWSLVGADLSAVLGQGELTLPANAQLARTFPSSRIALEILTQPVLGENSTDWPVLELGAASLIFARDGMSGRLILVNGDQVPRDLPIAFALDVDGRSLVPLKIGFSRDAKELTVAVGGQTLKFPADPVTGVTTEIVASAGALQPWCFQSLAVTVGSIDPVAPPKASNGRVSSGATDTAANADLSVGGNSPTPADVIAAALAAKNGRAPNAAVAPKDSTTLEIYTPPSVRHGRTEAVRAAIRGKSGN